MSHALMVVAQLGFIVVGAWLVHIDIREHRLPNRIVVPLAAGILALVALAAAAEGSLAPLARAVAAGLTLGCFYAVLRGISGGALGGGDVKLAAPVGLLLGWDGWTTLIVGGGLAFVMGGVCALALIATRRGSAQTAIAFGPFMVLAAVVGLAIT